MFLINEFLTFLNYSQVLAAYKVGGLTSLLTPDGILLLSQPLIPALIIFEIAAIIAMKRFKFNQYKVTVMTYAMNIAIGKILIIDALALVLKYVHALTPFQTTPTWYWYIYSYAIWELSQFVFHFSSHKIRLLWCAHAPHHIPQHMNLTVAYSGFFLQAIIAYAIRGSICILAGLSLPMLIVIILIDSAWGGLVHISEELIPDARLGFLRHFILTPQHHRVHHARNPEYIDKNFCNFLNIWDHLFRTYQAPIKGVTPNYGITRDIDANSFTQMYFAEFYYLFKDIWKTDGLSNKLLLLLMPPGWEPKH